MSKHLLIVSLLSLVMTVACSSGDNQGDHVWKEKTDTIEKAKQVEQSIQDAFDRNKKKMDEPGR